MIKERKIMFIKTGILGSLLFAWLILNFTGFLKTQHIVSIVMNIAALMFILSPARGLFEILVFQVLVNKKVQPSTFRWFFACILITIIAFGAIIQDILTILCDYKK